MLLATPSHKNLLATDNMVAMSNTLKAVAPYFSIEYVGINGIYIYIYLFIYLQQHSRKKQGSDTYFGFLLLQIVKQPEHLSGCLTIIVVRSLICGLNFVSFLNGVARQPNCSVLVIQILSTIIPQVSVCSFLLSLCFLFFFCCFFFLVS